MSMMFALRNFVCYAILGMLFPMQIVVTKELNKDISVKNLFFTRQICAYAQIRRFW